MAFPAVNEGIDSHAIAYLKPVCLGTVLDHSGGKLITRYHGPVCSVC